jgi:hypothetical protein
MFFDVRRQLPSIGCTTSNDIERLKPLERLEQLERLEPLFHLFNGLNRVERLNKFPVTVSYCPLPHASRRTVSCTENANSMAVASEHKPIIANETE